MTNCPNITLIVPQPLEPQQVKLWKTVVEKYLPQGVRGNTNILVGGHQKQTDFFVKKIHGKLGGYVVPLTRDLTEDEAGICALAWDRAYHDGDFVVDFSQHQNSMLFKAAIQEDILDEIADQVARRLHGDWITQRVNEGWNFGPRKNRMQHQDPKLLPWEQLNESFRSQERARVRKMLAILESINLHLIRR